ncbi:MAG: 50S ribosomal protein L44e [archaeon]|jgi:large subunit ribosomal protein L44e|nr:50S ribosomal protein L44e [Euryarchaeota archaeon]MDP7260486.1 50S ribosomal protein L44e [archaeon]HIK01274.1 50S ribosomal protein L44e [Candidatus Undinarchaeales archaeon ERR594346 U_76725]|tara:strand:+ start:52377 stop:52655 length:279 start_codon:yes stop_codon:yes gene_type:complete
MNIPKTLNMYCAWCKKHNAHGVFVSKKRQKRALSIGQRRFKRKMEGYGSFPKPMPQGKKPTQRQDLRFKCGECNKANTRAKMPRVKKFALTD